MITVDSSKSSPHEGRVWIAWMNYISEDHGGKPFVAYSDDHGMRWSRPFPTAVGYEPSLAVANAGSLAEASFDPRDDSIILWKLAPQEWIQAFHATETRSDWCGTNSRSLYLPAMPYRGVCAVPALALDPDRHAVYVAWSAPSSNGRRHVYFRRFTEASLTHGYVRAELPSRLEHTDARADQFLATIAVDHSDGEVWACYYDTAGDPSRRSTRFVCQQSADQGRSWTAVPIAQKRSNEATTFASHFGYGDYETVVAANGRAHAFWTGWASRANVEDVFTASLHR